MEDKDNDGGGGGGGGKLGMMDESRELLRNSLPFPRFCLLASRAHTKRGRDGRDKLLAEGGLPSERLLGSATLARGRGPFDDDGLGETVGVETWGKTWEEGREDGARVYANCWMGGDDDLGSEQDCQYYAFKQQCQVRCNYQLPRSTIQSTEHIGRFAAP